jgi:hypothetical protein
MNTALLSIELLVLGLGLGSASLASPRAIPLPATGRFAFGFATTPFVVASVVFLVSLIWPGAPRIVLVVAPAILTAALLWCCWRAILHVVRHRSSVQSRDMTFFILAIGVLLTAMLIAGRMIFFAQQPLGDADALSYLQEAKHFAAHRSFAAIAGMRGLEDGTLRGDQHGPLWVTWLASALMWGTNPGALERTLVRLPFEATIFFFFFSVIAVASALRVKYFALVSLLASVAVPRLFGTITAGDRDSFRLTGLLLLSSLLLAHLRPNLSRGTTWTALIVSAALVAFALQGHGLALVLVPLIVVTWGIVVVSARLPFLRIIVLGCALGVGFVVGASHVIDATWRTGSMTGDNVYEWDQEKGTPYEGSIEEWNKGQIGHGDDPLWRIGFTIARDGGWPGLVALLAIIGGFGRLIYGANVKSITVRQWRAICLGGWLIGYTLVVLGLFDLGRFQLGAWTIMNIRYSMQWYVAAALLAALGLSVVFSLLKAPLPLLAIAGALILSVGTASLIVSTWPYYPTGEYQSVSTALDELVKPLSPSCRILSEDQGINFYTQRPVVQLFSKYQRALLAAPTASELDSLLAQQHFCIVLLYNGLYVDMAGPETPFALLLKSKEFRRHDLLAWRIYVRSAELSN